MDICIVVCQYLKEIQKDDFFTNISEMSKTILNKSEHRSFIADSNQDSKRGTNDKKALVLLTLPTKKKNEKIKIALIMAITTRLYYSQFRLIH